MPEGQTAPQDPRTEFINVPVWHGSLDRAREILAAHPEVASSDIHTAALLGDHEAVARFLAEDPANATAKGGARNWDALTHLCFSKFLRLEPARPMPTCATARSRSMVPRLPFRFGRRGLGTSAPLAAATEGDARRPQAPVCRDSSWIVGITGRSRLSSNELVSARIKELQTVIAERVVTAEVRRRSWRVQILQNRVDKMLALSEARAKMYADSMSEGHRFQVHDRDAERLAIEEGCTRSAKFSGTRASSWRESNCAKRRAESPTSRRRRWLPASHGRP